MMNDLQNRGIAAVGLMTLLLTYPLASLVASVGLGLRDGRQAFMRSLREDFSDPTLGTILRQALRQLITGKNVPWV